MYPSHIPHFKKSAKKFKETKACVITKLLSIKLECKLMATLVPGAHGPLYSSGGKRKFDFRKSSTRGCTLVSPSPVKRVRRSKKTVSFSSNDVVIYYSKLSEEDLSKAWYTAEDWRNFKAECHRTIAAIYKANGDLSCVDLKEHCIRGLEEHISAFVYRKSPRQRTIVRRVVLVQQWQIETGTRDQTALQKTYLMLSRKHRCRALRRAAVDAFYSGAAKSYISPRYPEV
jgi:hypothetical protein